MHIPIAHTVRQQLKGCHDWFVQVPAEKVLSITPDRGHEFAKYNEVSSAVHQVPFFFADPYSPWQRGTNEYTNGLLRQSFPKNTSLDAVSDDELAAVVSKLNRRNSPTEIDTK
jgi:IS30 family transposase